jgi:ion channel
MKLPRQAARELGAIASSGHPTQRHLRERILLILGATALLDLLATVAIYFFERHANGSHIRTLGDSLFWVSTQLTTVSSQLPNPLSTGGRILDVFLQLWAVLFIASLAGSFGAFFHRRSQERDPIDLRDAI